MASNWDGFFPDTAVRLFVPAAGWVARAYLWDACHRYTCVVIPVLDFGIACGHWWANQPMEKINPYTFGNQSNGTKLFLVPIAVAIAFIFFDLRRIYDGA